MKVAGLPEGTYTQQAYIEMGSPGIYVPQKKGNRETIDFIAGERGVGILPKLNVYGGPVEEVMAHIWKLREAEMLGYYPLKIHHVLAGSGEIGELNQIHAHPQALMQCAQGLRELGANPDGLFSEAYKTPKLFETSEVILEIDDKTGSLATALDIFSRNQINLEYLHSTPYGREKFRFYILVKEKDLYKINSETLKSELTGIGGKLFQNEKSNNQVEGEVKLVTTKTNVDGIPLAKSNPKIGVICSEKTARENGLKIFENPFCPEDNETHFSVVSTMRENNIGDFRGIVMDKVMALLSLPDRVGVLSQALGVIKDAGLSLSFIMSLANNTGGYDFPLVMDKTSDILQAQREIKDMGGNLRVL